jgi:AP-1 complex subunit sigma 1/2
MINFLLLVSRQGKTRLSKWFVEISAKAKSRAMRELTASVLSRPPKMCNFIEWQDKKVVYKRYASLYFIACVDPEDNELIVLEQIHLFVEVLDKYFGNVCELDIIFNFHKAYYIVDELFIGGHLQVPIFLLLLSITTFSLFFLFVLYIIMSERGCVDSFHSPKHCRSRSSFPADVFSRTFNYRKRASPKYYE